MSPIDWTIVGVYLVWIVWDGLRLTKRSQELEGYFLGGRSLPWWAVGLSVMATQLSAITMIGTTGQGFTDGMRFLQFYYALPLAMIVLSVTLVPFFHNARIYTAYEYLERRFDAKTRAFTSLLFLLSRSMSLGVVISAPAVVLAVVMGFSVTATVLLIALPTAVYTMFGGVQAVTWTDVKQMVLIVAGLVAAVVVLVLGLPGRRRRGGGAEARRRHRPHADVRLQLRSHQPVHLLVGHDCRALPVLLLLRHRPEPGAALPHDRQRRRSARVAADERLLEDSAAGAGAARRRADVPVLRVRAHADAVQPRARARAAAGAAGAGVRRARTALRRRDRLAGGGGHRRRARRRHASAQARRAGRVRGPRRRGQGDPRRGAGAGAQRHRRPGLQRRQLRVSDVHRHAHADRPAGAADRGYLRGGDEHDFGGAGGALHRHDHRLLPPLLAARRRRRQRPAHVAHRHRLLGAVRQRRGRVGRRARLVHRGGEPLRVVLLRLDPRRLHAGDRLEGRHRQRRVHRPVCRHGLGGLGGRLHQGGLSLAQRHRRGGRGDRRRAGQPD